MTVTVRQLAELVHGQVHGDADLPITAARPLADAQAGDVTFVEDPRHAHQLPQSLASAVVVSDKFALNGKTLIRVADPLTAFIAIVRHLHGRPDEEAAPGIDPRAAVDPDVVLGPDVRIDAFASVGSGSALGARCRMHSGVVVGRYCRLGDDVVLYPNAVLYDGTILGDRVIVHANAVIGADGFGYRLQDGRHVKVPQLGRVEIGDDVEIGACTTIDRGTFQATRIGEGTKIDNLVQVGHNCQIGRHNLFVSQMGIAGSSQHRRLRRGGGAGRHRRSRPHRRPHHDRRRLRRARGRCGWPARPRRPARPIREQKRILVTLDKLPDMCKDVRRIKQKLGLDEADKETGRQAG